MKKTIGLGLKGNGIRKANPPVAYYFRVQSSFRRIRSRVNREAEDVAGRDDNSAQSTPPLQESAASFGADSTSVNLAEGTPAFSRPSR